MLEDLWEVGSGTAEKKYLFLNLLSYIQLGEIYPDMVGFTYILQ
jgi:hypothetical protein